MGCLSVQDMGNLFNEKISEDDIYDDLNNIYSDDQFNEKRSVVLL